MSEPTSTRWKNHPPKAISQESEHRYYQIPDLSEASLAYSGYFFLQANLRQGPMNIKAVAIAKAIELITLAK
jgi:hypothetical protein